MNFKKIHSFIICIMINAGFAMPAFAVSDANDENMTFAFVGDVMMGRTFPSIQLPPQDGAQLFTDAKPILKRVDMALGNLEGALCEGGTSTKGTGPNSYAFRTPPRYAKWLKDAGFDFMSMANNHSRDFGQTGIEQTEQALREQGIAFAGVAGRVEYTVVNCKGKKIGICAFGHNQYTVKHLDLNKVEQVLNALRAQTDFIIVSFHGGAEGRSKSHLPNGPETFLGENRGNLRQLAHFCIDHGADIVYGHGPHVLRCVEVYKGRFVAYSLGNFCTPYGVSLTGISGYAPLVEIKTDKNGRFISGQVHPFIQRPGVGPRADKTNAVIREMMTLTHQDIPNNPIKIDATGKITLK